MRILEQHRIDFISNETAAHRDATIFKKYAEGEIPVERVISDVKQKNGMRITPEQVFANVYWLGYGKTYEMHHKITQEEFMLIKWMGA